MKFFKSQGSRSKEEQYYKKLTIRNTFLTLLLFISPFLLLYLAVNYETSSLIKNQIYNRLADTVDENLKTIYTFLQDREMDLIFYSHLDIENIEDVSGYLPFFESLIEQKKWFDFFCIADRQGNIVLSTNTDIRGSIADREYFKISLNGKSFSSGIFYSDILNFSVMMLSHPLFNQKNQIIGVAAASLNLKNFYNLLFDMRIGKTSELFLASPEGFLLSPTKLGGKPFISKAFFEKEKNPHTGENGVMTHVDYRGQKVLCAYKKMPQTDFYLVSEMDIKEALLPLKEVNRIIFYLFIPFFLLLAILSRLYSRRMTTLLRKLTTNLQKALENARSKTKEIDQINVALTKKVQESERLTQELRLSEEYIFSLIDSISLGVIGLDLSGKITHANKEIKELFNLEDLKKGQDIFTALPMLTDRDIEVTFENTILTGRLHHLNEKKIDRGKGEEFFNLSFFPIENSRGEILGVTFLIENITEREKLRKQLAEYEKLSALSQLALGAAHEINNPLLGISSYLEILKEDAPDSKEKEEIDVVLENVYRISETIRGLLNFARPTPPQFTRVNINQLIDDTLSFLSHQPIFRKVKMDKGLSPSLPQITADLNQIRQVLTNMLINAAQSMPAGGTLRVETAKVKFQETIEIDISDTGVGIPPENLKKIFHPFFTTKKSQGTGLGLSISLSYIKNHSGDIVCRSGINQGTTFSIFLPIRQKGKKLLKDEEVIS
ncbi:MAG: ATP-binding protein [Candidatus Aminicenantales bacterium]